MNLSVFELFRIGIGPSSSHTVGPMRAARTFVLDLATTGRLGAVATVQVELFGSLGATGRGHGSDKAVLLGLMGETPEDVVVAEVDKLVARVRVLERLALLHQHEIDFREPEHLQLLLKNLPYHPNGMRFTALDASGATLSARVFYSVGGGFVVEEGVADLAPQGAEPPHAFRTGEELLRRCREAGLSVGRLMLENERTWRSRREIYEGLLNIWAVMQACVKPVSYTHLTLPTKRIV